MANGRSEVPTFGPPDIARLADIAAQTHALPAGTPLWRVYSRAGRYPTRWNAFRFFGPSEKSRFDHHEEPARLQQRGILYSAPSIPVCVAEVFQRDRTIDRLAGERQPFQQIIILLATARIQPSVRCMIARRKALVTARWRRAWVAR